MTAIPGWYPDPAGTGALRYFDGASWTAHMAVVPPMPPRWKGSRLGRPQYGPGAIADPGRRLAARLLDWLIILPVPIVLLIISFAGFVHWTQSLSNRPPNGVAPLADLLWFELLIFAIVLGVGVCAVLYEALTTIRWGRTPGKAIMKIRPLRLDGAALSAGRAFGRAGAYYVGSLVQIVQILDVLWCLWDEDGQCLHDKVCETLVVSDT